MLTPPCCGKCRVAAMALLVILAAMQCYVGRIGSWTEEFIAHYSQRDAVDLSDLALGWEDRTLRYGVLRPTRPGCILVYRAFDLGVTMGPFSRATMEVYADVQVLSRVTMHWPDLGQRPKRLLLRPTHQAPRQANSERKRWARRSQRQKSWSKHSSRSDQQSVRNSPETASLSGIQPA